MQAPPPQPDSQLSPRAFLLAFTRRLIPGGLFLPSKKPSSAQNATKATKPKAKPTPKKPVPTKPPAPAKKSTKAKAAPAPTPAASKWRVVSPAPVEAPAPESQREPGRALMVVAQPEPLTPWKEFKAGLPETFDDFISYIAQGGHMAAFCKSKVIPYTTLLTWLAADPSKSEMYARAREDRADVLADEIVAISDEVEVVARMHGEEVVLAVDAAAVSRNKLRVDARKWAASKLKPRTYGDKIELGGTVNHKGMSDMQLLDRLAAFGVAVKAIRPDQGEVSDDA